MVTMGGLARTFMLFTVLTALLMGIGTAAGYLIGIPPVQALSVALIFAIILNIGMYYSADKWVLRLYRAKIISESEMPELHRIVARLAQNARLPKPRVAVVPLKVPNAFATGRSPKHSLVAVTEGALELLNEEELEGVLGHEITHIKNRDMLVNTLAAIIGATITYVMYFSIFSGGSRDRDGGAGLLAIIAIFIIPIAAMLVRLAISRGREFEADRGGATISRKPLALASALRKLELKAREGLGVRGNPSTAHLFIVNPFRGAKVSSLFSTHPSTEERIKRLEWMAKTGKY